MKNNAGIVIAVRMKSTRLPKKALLKIKGKTVIEHLIDRLKIASEPACIILCTSTHPDDAILAEIAEKNGIESFRGSEDDKLERFLGAAEKFSLDFLAAVDGDDILCDPVYVDRTIQTLVETGADMVRCNELPLGTACNGLKVDALKKVCEMKGESDTEVWGGYFTDSDIFKVIDIIPEEELKRPDIRLTLDYPEDFKVFEIIFDNLYTSGSVFNLAEIVSILNKKPEILEINRKVHEEYLKGIREKTKKIRMREK
jgi:spore coat polysaccharide biosynthesis protein SpsF